MRHPQASSSPPEKCIFHDMGGPENDARYSSNPSYPMAQNSRAISASRSGEVRSRNGYRDGIV